MPRITFEQQDEYHRLKQEQSALKTLMSRAVAFEAAIRVIVRHDLLAELADEIKSQDEGSPTDASARMEEAPSTLPVVPNSVESKSEVVESSQPRWEVGKNGWDASDEATREDI